MESGYTKPGSFFLMIKPLKIYIIQIIINPCLLGFSWFVMKIIHLRTKFILSWQGWPNLILSNSIACERGGSDGLSALRSGQSRLHRMSRPKRSEVTDDPTRPRLEGRDSPLYSDYKPRLSLNQIDRPGAFTPEAKTRYRWSKILFTPICKPILGLNI